MGVLFSKANGVVWLEVSVYVGDEVGDDVVSGFPTPFLGCELTEMDDTSESGLVVISEIEEDVVVGGSTCGLLTTGALADGFGVATIVEVITTVVGGIVITAGGGGGRTGKVGVGGDAGDVGDARAIEVVEVEGASCRGGNDCRVGEGVSGGGSASVATGCLLWCSSSSSSESESLPCLFLVP